jgi:putative endonuclease
MEKTYHIYILASRSRVLYVGVTDDLIGRVAQHRNGLGSEFTAKYRIHRLVYQESFRDIRAAIAREKQIKRWARGKKANLIEMTNPTWLDLARDWFPPYPRKAGPSASLGMTNSHIAPETTVPVRIDTTKSHAQA